MELIFTARSREQEGTAYTSLSTHKLRADVNMTVGTGRIDDPKQAQIMVKNENSQRWHGVIHIELAFDKQQPRFFCLPLCMVAIGEARKMYLMNFQDCVKENLPVLRPLGGWSGVIVYPIRLHLYTIRAELSELAPVHIG